MTNNPALTWAPPEDLRRPLFAARDGLREAEARLADELVACFRVLTEGATPAERKTVVDIYVVTCEGRGGCETSRGVGRLRDGVRGRRAR